MCLFIMWNFMTVLITVQLTKNINCLYFNNSHNGPFDSTFHSLFRPKRSPSEYTRWRADYEPTEEFIVKVFEEDLPEQNSQVASINYAQIIPENNGRPLQTGPDSAESVETEGDPNSDHLTINQFSKSNVGDSLMAPVPVYTNNKIISQKTYRGKIDTRYPKVKYMSLQSESQDALLDSRFLSNLDSPAQQFAPIEHTLLYERTSPPLLQMKPLSSDYDSLLNSKVTRTTPKTEIIPIRTLITEKFSPIRTTKPESFTLPNIVKDTFSPFEYIHPLRTTSAEKPLRKVKKLFNMITGTTKTNLKKVSEAYIDIDDVGDSIEMKTIDYKEVKIIKNDNVNEMRNECQEIELYDNEASTKSVNFTVMQKLFSKITRTTTISGIERRANPDKFQINCTMIKKREVNGSPRTLHEIVMQLKTWAENSPVAKWVDITNGNYTTMENPIYMMIVDDLSKGQIVSAKETVMIVAGIQGKDHHAVLAAMSMLQQLIEKSESHSDLLRRYRFWIIPVLNPDGYDYSMTFPLRRHWMKNLRQTWNIGKDEGQRSCQTLGITCTLQTCYGVNVDRNFEYQWIPTKELQTEHPCGLLYAGPRQLSETETRSLSLYLDKKHIHTFIAYKEGDVLGVLYPYSHTKKKRPLDHFYRVRSMRAATAASVAGGRTYVYGQTSEYLPLYAGGIEDWVDGHLGIDNIYSVMMMRRTDDVDSEPLMERVANEAFAATHALLFSSDFDQTFFPVAVGYKNTGPQRTIPNVICITYFVKLLGHV